jgi:uncharacterized protein
MIFVDSSFFIALALKNDHWHPQAKKLAPIVEESDKIISDLVLSESVTMVGSMGGGKKGKLIYDYLMDNCNVVYADHGICDNSIHIYLKYDGVLSFADSVSVELMNQNKIKKIISFDSDFDKINTIERVY